MIPGKRGRLEGICIGNRQTALLHIGKRCAAGVPGKRAAPAGKRNGETVFEGVIKSTLAHGRKVYHAERFPAEAALARKYNCEAICIGPGKSVFAHRKRYAAEGLSEVCNMRALVGNLLPKAWDFWDESGAYGERNCEEIDRRPVSEGPTYGR